MRAISTIIKYLDMHVTASKIFTLNKKLREYLIKQNYALFNIFISRYVLNRRLKRTDFVAKHNIFELFKFCARDCFQHLEKKK